MARNSRSDGFQKQKKIIYCQESPEYNSQSVEEMKCSIHASKSKHCFSQVAWIWLPVAGDVLLLAVRLHFLSKFDTRSMSPLLAILQVEILLLMKEILHLSIPIGS